MYVISRAIKGLDEIDKEILLHVSNGLTAKEIERKLKVTKHTVWVRIREMKKYYDCQSTAHLVKKTRELIS